MLHAVPSLDSRESYEGWTEDTCDCLRCCDLSRRRDHSAIGGFTGSAWVWIVSPSSSDALYWWPPKPWCSVWRSAVLIQITRSPFGANVRIAIVSNGTGTDTARPSSSKLW